MENYDIDTIISLFRERGNASLFMVNGTEPDKLHSILDRFPILEKYSCFTFQFNLKQGKSIKQLLKDNQYTEHFSTDDLNQVLNSEITTTSAFIIFFNIFSFLYYSDNNDQKNVNSKSTNCFENEMTIDVLALFMRCLINLAHFQHRKSGNKFDKSSENFEETNPEQFLQPEFYDRLIYFFFKNIILCSLHFFEDNDRRIDQNLLNECVLLFLAFFDNQKRLPASFFDFFISFIFKSKVQEYAEHVLGLLYKMFKEKRPLVIQNDVSKIIEYINPYLITFNQRALDLIVIISTTFKTQKKSVIECFSNLSLSLINIVLESTPKIIIEDEDVDLPYNKEDSNLNENNSNADFIKELSFTFIETESRFEKGFIYPHLSMNGNEWLLRNIDSNILKVISQLIFSFASIDAQILDNFFSTFKDAISKMNSDFYFDVLAIFYHFLITFRKYKFIHKYFDFILNPKLFNEKETIFTSLSENKNAFRNAAINILSDYPEKVGTFIINSLNPLFRSELLFRIKNAMPFYSIILDVANVCCSLRTLDIKWHCEEIEKARCVSFCFLSELFLGMYNSYIYFEEVMQFCLEKRITDIFINLYKESTLTSKNFELLQKVFNFITKIFNVSLELSWKFIKITNSIFEKRSYLVPQMKKFFILIMNYIMKLKLESNLNSSLISEIKNIEKRSFKAVKMSLSYISLFKSISPKHLHIISSQLSHHMLDEFFFLLLEQMGKSPKFNNKIDCFMIKVPIFIPILLFSCGFTNKVMRIFSSLCFFSIKNSIIFHDQQVDSILIQILQNKKVIKYRNEIFDDFYYDSTIPKDRFKDLLFLICSYKTDLRVVSQLLNDKRFIPFINSLLTHYQNNKLPILSIPSMSAETQFPLKYSHFSKDFSFSFWIIFDINYLSSFPAENIELITVYNGLYRFGLYLQGVKLRAYYANGKTRSDVNLNFFKTNKCVWTFVSTSYHRERKGFDTFCYEMPMNKSEFEEIYFNDQNPITIQINSALQKRIYNPKNNYYQFYSFPENDFIGFIKDIRFYGRKLSSNEIFDLSNRPLYNEVSSIISLSNPIDFIVNYQHSDNLFNVLRRETIITEFEKMLLQPNQEESICYEILNIIGKLADVIKIPFASLMIFVIDSNHFKFKSTFSCFYFIFENIKSNQLIRIKFFNVFITNALIWSHYVNFKDVLNFYQTKLIIHNFDLLVNHTGFDLFLYYFELINMSYWCEYNVFLKRLLEKAISRNRKDEQMIILNSIKQKFIHIKNESSKLINNQHNLSSIVFNQLKLELSSIAAFYPSIYQPETEIKTDDNSIFRTKKVAEIHANKYAASVSKKDKKKAKDIEKFDEIQKDKNHRKKIELLDDIPDEYKDFLLILQQHPSNQMNSENILIDDNSNNESNIVYIADKDRMSLIYLIQLINFKSVLFSKIKETFFILIRLLKIKDLQLTENVLMALYNVSSELSISSFTLNIYNYLNKEFFSSIFQFLKTKIEQCPNFFPLICSLVISIDPQPNCFEILNNFKYLDRNSSTNSDSNSNVTFDLYHNSNENLTNLDPWFLFPIILGFSLEEDMLVLLFKILMQNSRNDWKIIEKMVILFDFMSNYFENRIILTKFLEYAYEFDNSFLFEVVRLSAMMLLAHPYLADLSIINLSDLIKNESIISKSIAYQLGIHLYQRGKFDKSYEILLKLIDKLPLESLNESDDQLIFALNYIFRSEIKSSISFFEMSSTCDQLIKDYKIIFEKNFKDILFVLRNIIQSSKKRTKIKYHIVNQKKAINDNLEITNNERGHLVNGKRLSSQFDCVFRQMIYRSDEKLPKYIEPPDVNCFLLINDSINKIGINYEQNGNKVRIITPTSQRYFDLSGDVYYSFKRTNSGEFEIFTKFGKKYRLNFYGKYQKKDISQNNINKIFDEIVDKWSLSEITNFEFLMNLNAFADNIHKEKAIFPSPLYKRKAMPDGEWSSSLSNKDSANEVSTKIKKFSLLSYHRKKKSSAMNNKKKSNAISNLMNKFSNGKVNDRENDVDENSNSNNFNDNDNNEIINDDNEINDNINDDNEINDSDDENDSNYRYSDHDIIKYCFENQIVPARYFYDFELYNERLSSQSIDTDDGDESKSNHKDEFELMYNMRKCIENYSSINAFAEYYLGIKISGTRKLIERKNIPGIFQSNTKDTLIFAVSLKSVSQNDCSSFLVINSNFYVKYFTYIDETEHKTSNLFLTNLASIDVNLQKPTILNESTFTSYIFNNFSLLSGNTNYVNETNSLILDNVNNKSQLFQLDDGVAAFDPNNKILIIFTTSSIETITSSPSPLSLTSPSPLDSDSMVEEFVLNSHHLTPLILSTSISGVNCKTYTTPLSDSVNLLCGNSERQFYTVSPTVVYSNNRFFIQFDSDVKILKVSMIFNVVVAATEDGKVHICSSTSGKRIATINMEEENDKILSTDSKSCIQSDEISEIVITHNFGFLLIIMKNGNLFLYTINGTLIKSTQIETKHRGDKIRFWFTFDTIQGIDYVGFVTDDEKIFYFEAFYPSTLVQMTNNEKFKNILAVNYDKFSRCFLVLNSNCEISVVTHNVLVVPINYDLI